MSKRLIVFNIKKEKTWIALAAAINKMDKESIEIIDRHAIEFESNKTLKEILKIILEKTGIECPPDEFLILTYDKPFAGVGRSFAGIGITTDGLKKLLGK